MPSPAIHASGTGWLGLRPSGMGSARSSRRGQRFASHSTRHRTRRRSRALPRGSTQGAAFEWRPRTLRGTRWKGRSSTRLEMRLRCGARTPKSVACMSTSRVSVTRSRSCDAIVGLSSTPTPRHRLGHAPGGRCRLRLAGDTRRSAIAGSAPPSGSRTIAVPSRVGEFDADRSQARCRCICASRSHTVLSTPSRRPCSNAMRVSGNPAPNRPASS